MQPAGSTAASREVCIVSSIPAWHSYVSLLELNFSLNFSFFFFLLTAGVDSCTKVRKKPNFPPSLGITPLQMLVQGFTSSSALSQHLAELCSSASQPQQPSSTPFTQPPSARGCCDTPGGTATRAGAGGADPGKVQQSRAER